MANHQRGRSRDDRGGRTATAEREPLFDPGKPLSELVDSLAEQQARMMPDSGRRGELKSSQLRRFFGDVKDLLRRLERGADFETQIKPMFKMTRSKASYAYRAGQGQQSKIPVEFYSFLDKGIARVNSEEDFRKFIQHFEAVVGFLYGLGKVGK